MNTAILSIALTWGEWSLLEAAKSSPVRVSGPRVTQARRLVDKGLGSLGEATVNWLMFEANEAGRDQLRIRQ